MNEKNAFYAGLRIFPKDHITQLVFADWLDERASEGSNADHAKFIRLSVELQNAGPKKANSEHAVKWQHAQRLLAKHWREWLGQELAHIPSAMNTFDDFASDHDIWANYEERKSGIPTKMDMKCAAFLLRLYDGGANLLSSCENTLQIQRLMYIAQAKAEPKALRKAATRLEKLKKDFPNIYDGERHNRIGAEPSIRQLKTIAPFDALSPEAQNAAAGLLPQEEQLLDLHWKRQVTFLTDDQIAETYGKALRDALLEPDGKRDYISQLVQDLTAMGFNFNQKVCDAEKTTLAPSYLMLLATRMPDAEIGTAMVDGGAKLSVLGHSLIDWAKGTGDAKAEAFLREMQEYQHRKAGTPEGKVNADVIKPRKKRAQGRADDE